MHIGKKKVVIDTNIVISAMISKEGKPARILQLLFEKKIINFITKEILEEINGVLRRPLFRKYIDENYKQVMLENFVINSILVDSKYNEKIIDEDESDNMFINCALTVGADIISGDNHLLKLNEYQRIKIFSVNEFLDEIGLNH
ncbi:MAG: putative toxin-antitoxin system toxin component, PIN family [Candidatus Woesearchaeota archaeon]